MSTLRSMTIIQAVVALAALVGITFLGYTGDVNSDALVAIYSAVLGAALGASSATNGIVRDRKVNGNNGGTP